MHISAGSVFFTLAYELCPLPRLPKDLFMNDSGVVGTDQLVRWLCRMSSQQDQETDLDLVTASSHRTCELGPF